MRLVAAIGSALLLSTVFAAQAQMPTGDEPALKRRTTIIANGQKGYFQKW